MARSAHRAFSLLELLVGVAVVALLVIVLAGITSGTQKTVGSQRAKLDSQHAATELFTQIARDLDARVSLPAAHFFWGNNLGDDEIAFYTSRPGYAGNRMASWVHYRLNPSDDALNGRKAGDTERGASGTDYNNGPGGTSILTYQNFNPPPDPTIWASYAQIPPAYYQALTDQILRIEISALVEIVDSSGNRKVVFRANPPRFPVNSPPQSTGNTINTVAVPATSSDPGILRGIVVTIVALDSRSLVFLDASQRTAIAAKFPDAGDGAMPSAAWTPIAEALSSTTSTPLPLAQNVRVYERIFSLHQ